MAESPAHNNAMSRDEIALYDRQIRLWGVKAQERLRSANVLLITVKALGSEIAKHLVLVGIGSLTLVDDAQVRAEDLGAQFFVTEANINQNRAEAAAPQIQQLNPRVRIQPDPSHVKSKPPEFFGAFDLVISTDLDFDTLSTINAACRIANKPYYAAGLHGFYGFVFADLISHDFVVEREKSNIPSPTNETPTRTILDITTKMENQKMIEMVTKRETYTPLILANSSPLPDEFTRTPRKRKDVTPLITCLRTLWEFQRQHGGAYPSFSREDLEHFTSLANERHLELKLDPSSLTAEFLRSFLQNVGSELNPTAAFLGASLAQDVVNVLSAREQPLQNLLLFDGERNYGPIYALRPFFPDNTNGG